MREIKFRAFEKTKNLLIGVGTFYFTYKSILLDNGEEYCFDEVELMQYTGLKDKNGVEIYEGDIIHAFSVEKPLEVVYRNGAFGYFGVFHNSFESFAGNYNFDFSKLDIEVIGNIYESAFLLETD